MRKKKQEKATKHRECDIRCERARIGRGRKKKNELALRKCCMNMDSLKNACMLRNGRLARRWWTYAPFKRSVWTVGILTRVDLGQIPWGSCSMLQHDYFEVRYTNHHPHKGENHLYWIRNQDKEGQVRWKRNGSRNGHTVGIEKAFDFDETIFRSEQSRQKDFRSAWDELRNRHYKWAEIFGNFEKCKSRWLRVFQLENVDRRYRAKTSAKLNGQHTSEHKLNGNANKRQKKMKWNKSKLVVVDWLIKVDCTQPTKRHEKGITIDWFSKLNEKICKWW